jgi:hypothetical protein
MKDKETAESKDYPEFYAEDLPAPDNTKVGEKFEVLAMVEAKEGGKFCLVSVDGVPVSKGKKKTEGTNDGAPMMDSLINDISKGYEG